MLCLLAVGLGFLLPGGILVQMVVENRDQIFDEQFWTFATNSLILSGISATLAVLLAVILSYGTRQHPSKLMRFAVQVAAMGYAIPGSVIAVGVLLPIGQLDNAIANWMQSTWGISTGLLLSGTIVALVFAYLVRFLAVSFSTVDASLLKIKPNLDEAARSLGHGTLSTLARIHLPMITPGLLTAAVLVFVDVMKELPMTLIIRPFNFDTLAVRVYNLASDERLAEAAAPALAIVLVGLIPVMLLSVRMSRFRAPQR
jgi:iron(III) transport system permease protein